MTYQRPAWADALANVLGMMKEQAPVATMLPMVQMMAPGSTVTDADLAEFVSHADHKDLAIMQFHLALAKWDADDNVPDADGNPTAPNTADRRPAVYAALGLSREVSDVLSRRIPAYAELVISKKFVPWYIKEGPSRVSAYWKNYAKYLHDIRGWPAESIATLDRSSTEVVERLSNPTRTDARRSKGLVVGYVQSGKTANFTGVVAKAIDAGYRLVIVMTGTIEMLRAQTQRRMDMELIGYENVLAGRNPDDPEVARSLDYQQDQDWPENFVHHGSDLKVDGIVGITRLTSHVNDFQDHPSGIRLIDPRRPNGNLPFNHQENLSHNNAYVAIVKKNASPLGKLVKELRRLDKESLDGLPVLIIDDESDQAGVNTENPDAEPRNETGERSRTRINGLIRDIIELCPRAQYVGYTATLFANVFIDPDDDSELFPSDFILSLHRPPGYMGVQEFHDVDTRWDDEQSKTYANSNELAHIRPVKGTPELSPDIRQKELQEALDAWVLTGAIKKYREANSDLRFRHHTMLVHETVRTDKHVSTRDDLIDLWRLSGFNTSTGHDRLRHLFEKDFLPVMQARANGAPIPPTFESLKSFIGDALAAMESTDSHPVLVINSDTEVQRQQEELDFQANPVWRILVGGSKLSRGFTVEDLTITYYRRRTIQADTLMQAGRWFGFRPGYQDLVRLYILRTDDVDLYEAFEALLLDEDAFREELGKYVGFRKDGQPIMEPHQVPPLISQHLPWLRPTARNKMWNAVITNQAPSGVHEFYGLPERGDPANAKNFSEVVVPFLTHAQSRISLTYEFNGHTGQQLSARAGLIGADDALALLNRHVWHPDYDESVEPIRKFLTDATRSGKITDWAVVLPETAGRRFSIPELGGEVPIVKRKRRAASYGFVGSDPRHRAAVAQIARGESVPGLGSSPTRGVIFIYITPDRNPDTGEISRDDLVGLIAIAAPTSSLPKRGLIQWTVRSSKKPDEATIDPKEADAGTT